MDQALEARRRIARRVAFAYLAGAGAWIVFSDLVLKELTLDPQALGRYSVVKGVIFVFISSVLLYRILLNFLLPFTPLSADTPLDGLFPYLNDIILVTDIDGRIVDANQRAVERYGYSRQELIGMPSDKLRAPNAPRSEFQLVEANSAGVTTHESLHVTRAGDVFPVLASWRRVEREGRVFIEAIIRDISQLILAQKDAAEGADKYRSLFESSADAVLLGAPDGTIFEANAEACRMFGRSEEEIRKGGRMGLVDPNDPRLPAATKVRTQQERGRAVTGFRRKDGSVFSGEFSSANYKDREGKIRSSVVIRDISATERVEAERNERLRRSEAHLAALNAVTVSPSLISGDVELFARALTETAAKAVGAERANVWLFNHGETEMRCVDLYEATPATHSAGAVLKQEQFAPEFAALKAATYVDANEPLTDPRTVGYAEGYLKPLHITSMLDAVVRFSGKNIGVVCLEHVDRPHHWQRDEIAFACQLADKFALAIINRDRRNAEQKLRRSLENSIQAIAATVEARDPYTAGHERRVAEIAAAIATEMSLPPNVVEGIHFGGLLHDLGKIQVPAEILSKPTRLTPVEKELVNHHAQAGYDILKCSDFPWPVAEMARQHHERIDGSGYPRGLKGDEILLEARVLAVADTLESMASHRPYRPALGIDAALAEIERGRGNLYDVGAADACLRLFREQHYSVPA